MIEAAITVDIAVLIIICALWPDCSVGLFVR